MIARCQERRTRSAALLSAGPLEEAGPVSASGTAVAFPPGTAHAERLALGGRAILLLCFLVWTWRFVSQPMGTAVLDSFLHLVNLPFHEAGHMLLMPFGRFLMVLGGSLFQILVPLVCMTAFLRQNGDPFGAAIMLWWAGQNFMDLAPYIGDARALDLVLLGGYTGKEVEGHDWEYLLLTLGWLEYDLVLAAWAHWIGAVLMILALLWGGLTLARQYAPPRGWRW